MAGRHLALMGEVILDTNKSPGQLRIVTASRLQNSQVSSRTFKERSMTQTPVKIAVTGAAGQICYSLLFRIASG
ncbi:hypothetical protein HMPREF9582_01822 [Cutibacterium acnes HL060PA1]|nr:hypothetical protein HMPREF9582_01822 [Cutibacterium acnes HL060PA1]